MIALHDFFPPSFAPTPCGLFWHEYLVSFWNRPIRCTIVPSLIISGRSSSTPSLWVLSFLVSFLAIDRGSLLHRIYRHLHLASSLGQTLYSPWLVSSSFQLLLFVCARVRHNNATARKKKERARPAAVVYTELDGTAPANYTIRGIETTINLPWSSVFITILSTRRTWRRRHRCVARFVMTSNGNSKVWR